MLARKDRRVPWTSGRLRTQEPKEGLVWKLCPLRLSQDTCGLLRRGTDCETLECMCPGLTHWALSRKQRRLSKGALWHAKWNLTQCQSGGGRPYWLCQPAAIKPGENYGKVRERGFQLCVQVLK